MDCVYETTFIQQPFYFFKNTKIKRACCLDYPSDLPSLSVIFIIEMQLSLHIKMFLHHHLFHIRDNCQFEPILLDFLFLTTYLKFYHNHASGGRTVGKKKRFWYFYNCGALAYLTTYLKDAFLQKPTQQNHWQEKFPWLIFYKQAEAQSFKNSGKSHFFFKFL